jgi:hypothetical protein
MMRRPQKTNQNWNGSQCTNTQLAYSKIPSCSDFLPVKEIRDIVSCSYAPGKLSTRKEQGFIMLEKRKAFELIVGLVQGLL